MSLHAATIRGPITAAGCGLPQAATSTARAMLCYKFCHRTQLCFPPDGNLVVPTTLNNRRMTTCTHWTVHTPHTRYMPASTMHAHTHTHSMAECWATTQPHLGMHTLDPDTSHEHDNMAHVAGSCYFDATLIHTRMQPHKHAVQNRQHYARMLRQPRTYAQTPHTFLTQTACHTP